MRMHMIGKIKKNYAKVQNMQLRFVRQTILRIHMTVQIKKYIEKKKGKKSGRTIQFKTIYSDSRT